MSLLEDKQSYLHKETIQITGWEDKSSFKKFVTKWYLIHGQLFISLV